MKEEAKQVRLGDYPFLKMLTQRGWCWQGATLDRVISIVAIEGSIGDWAAYMETPDSGPQVALYGDKIPRVLAEELFPLWANNYAWRP